MKRYKKLLLLLSVIFVLSSCADNNSTNGDNDSDETVELKALHTAVGLIGANNGTSTSRAVEDFSVNTNLDPTASMTFRSNWELDLQIYKSGAPYPEGEATFTLDQINNIWMPDRPIFFPNYTKQSVSAILYPPTWQNRVDEIQDTEGYLLAQDVLTQDGENTVVVNPAHIPTIKMKHEHSMLDFIIENVDESHIADLKVQVGTVIYKPYKVNSSRVEYLVILPTYSSYPEIKLRTVDGIEYTERINFSSTQSNVAYCLRFEGVELTLSTINVADWAMGKALSGNYSASTSYPTFQGIPSATYTLYFDNGLKQDITFNSNGERTIKPVGRTLIRVEKDGEAVNLNIVLRSMIIDLMPYALF